MTFTDALIRDTFSQAMKTVFTILLPSTLYVLLGIYLILAMKDSFVRTRPTLSRYPKRLRGMIGRLKAVSRIMGAVRARFAESPWKDALFVLLLACLSRAVIFTSAAVLTSHSPFDPSVLLKWDAHHYLKLAELGYSDYTETCPDCGDNAHIFLVFFPLYPWFVRLFSLITAGNAYAAAIISSNLFFFLGIWYAFLLARRLVGRKGAYAAVLFLAFAPASIFFSMPYTESLFLFVSAASLYYASGKKWLPAALFGGLAAMTRMVGIMTLIPPCIIWIEDIRIHSITRGKQFSNAQKNILRFILPMCLIPAGAFAYLLLNWYVEGNPFRFLFYQKHHWGNTAVPVWKTLETQWGYFWGYLPAFDAQRNGETVSNLFRSLGIHLSNLISFALAVAAAFAGFAKEGKRLRPFILYLGAYVIVSFSASWLLSGTRYMLACVPLYPALALLCRGRMARGVIVPAYILFSAGMQVLFLFGSVL